MSLVPYTDIALLATLTVIIVGAALGRLSGRWLVLGFPLAFASIILAPLSGSSVGAEPAKADPVFPDRNRQAVVDAANVLPDEQEHVLAKRIGAYVKRTGHKLVVATVPSLNGLQVRD